MIANQFLVYPLPSLLHWIFGMGQYLTTTQRHVAHSKATLAGRCCCCRCAHFLPPFRRVRHTNDNGTLGATQLLNGALHRLHNATRPAAKSVRAQQQYQPSYLVTSGRRCGLHSHHDHHHYYH
jgi:hypothetical protein